MSDTTSIPDRDTTLEERRVGEMAESAHAFVRGNTVQHYAWLSEMPALPQGPPVWICGDCHVGNLGPIIDKNGDVDIQVRDLDQTTIGNPAHDIVRLALSLSCIARRSDLPGATTARIVESLIDGYQVGLQSLKAEEPAKEPNTVASVRREALGRKWHHLATERLGNVRPTIPLGKKFWELSDDEKWSIGTLLDSPDVKKLILALNKRTDRAKVELIDAAYWMKGCSSLGKLRFAALVHVSGERKDRLSLVDIKEAAPAAALAAVGVGIPADHAQRVVAGARAMAPNLGDRMAAGTIGNRPVVIRELMPEDLKLEMEQFSRKEAITAARYLAGVVGKANGRQMTSGDRTSWANDVANGRSKDAAPSWLWTPVVTLLAQHERAYLDHCRLHDQASSDGRLHSS